MGALILSGGGSAEQNVKAHEAFVERLDQRKPLLYIPVAGDPEQRPHEESFRYIKNCLKPFGMSKFKMWTEINDRSIEEIQTYSGVYISGGCSLKLRRLMGESGFDRILLEYYKQGGVVFGQSAGAMLFGEAPSGGVLNLVEGYRIWCHYKPENKREIDIVTRRDGLQILAMEDGGSVLVSDKTIKRVSGGIYIFDRGKKNTIQ
ncbi:Type 1 glutamine amidotransferase-like domain-containing protein [Halobacillus sp. Nhm2S1]|uniref:Type 1 glutamine amidotransferase-like domain-containing protein n=1 Tax=Halobacillus sp. Nhm2S1 TaxID=2866716 RepID=UPI001C737876|nr:Type 1 glutamine amidotransferase-like domain-containing protein [Halobacillus sp. Nhm2S1]MBX0356696.1 peptidase E [Halobacillus sp. Nhm2S1]